MQGAGGVGGLLEVNDTLNGVHFAAYDGNGNVAALVQATAGTNSATYEYGPFGELLRATGPMAKANPLRFSTKWQDDETDFLYYCYRFYNPSTGRWLSRDPKQERAGRNLYGLVANAPLQSVDRDGRDAAVLNFGGYAGHTFLIVNQPSSIFGDPVTPGIVAYHFYGYNQYIGSCGGFGGYIGAVCDKAKTFPEPPTDINSLIARWQPKEGPLTVLAYALGTELDDQLLIAELNDEVREDAGIYSLLLGIECHTKAWEWFHSYTAGGRRINPVILVGPTLPYPPKQWWETLDYADTF
jgi:RHS repeat-associated protein